VEFKVFKGVKEGRNGRKEGTERNGRNGRKERKKVFFFGTEYFDGTEYFGNLTVQIGSNIPKLSSVPSFRSKAIRNSSSKNFPVGK
jgi:hypothetical protein